MLSGAHGVGLRHIVGRFREAIVPTPLDPILASRTDRAPSVAGGEPGSDTPRVVLVDLHDGYAAPPVRGGARFNDDIRRLDLGAIGACVATDRPPTMVLLVVISDTASRRTWLHGLRRLGPHVTEIEVPPLPTPALTRYLGGRFPDLGADALAEVVALSGGLPSIATSLAGEHPSTASSEQLVATWLAQLDASEQEVLLALAASDTMAVTPVLERFGFAGADAIDRARTLDLLRPTDERPLGQLRWVSELVPRALRRLAETAEAPGPIDGRETPMDASP